MHYSALLVSITYIVLQLELETNLCKDFTIMEEAPFRVVLWVKAPIRLDHQGSVVWLA